MGDNTETKLILDAIDRVEDKFDDTITDIKTLLTKQSNTLYGNGRPGLTTTMELVEKDVGILNRKEHYRAVFKTRVITGVLISILSVSALALVALNSGGL